MDGVGYAYKPNSCIDFLQCIHVNGHIKVEVGHCPIGTYFDEKTVICRHYNGQYCRRGETWILAYCVFFFFFLTIFMADRISFI